MKKLNKSQNWELILNAVANAVAETNSLKKGNEDKFTAELLNQLDFLKPKQGGGSSTKMNEDGEVYCNYFDAYFPADSFNTKTSSKTGKESYKANCIDAEIIIRKIKSLRSKVEKQVMDNFMDKTIDAETMTKYLNNLDDALNDVHYASVDDVPNVSEIILADTDFKPTRD